MLEDLCRLAGLRTRSLRTSFLSALSASLTREFLSAAEDPESAGSPMLIDVFEPYVFPSSVEKAVIS